MDDMDRLRADVRGMDYTTALKAERREQVGAAAEVGMEFARRMAGYAIAVVIGVVVFGFMLLALVVSGRP